MPGASTTDLVSSVFATPHECTASKFRTPSQKSSGVVHGQYTDGLALSLDVRDHSYQSGAEPVRENYLKPPSQSTPSSESTAGLCGLVLVWWHAILIFVLHKHASGRKNKTQKTAKRTTDPGGTPTFRRGSTNNVQIKQALVVTDDVCRLRDSRAPPCAACISLATVFGNKRQSGVLRSRRKTKCSVGFHPCTLLHIVPCGAIPTGEVLAFD